MGCDMDFFTSTTKFFAEGGFWMFPIFIAQVAALVIIADRVTALYLRRQANQQGLAQAFEADIRRGELETVVRRAQSLSSDSSLRRVIEAGATAAINMGGREEVQAKMDEVLFAEQTNLEKRIEFLSMIGNVSTLLGLLGTIVGMIRSFTAISSADQVTKATLLAQGISEAMHATAYGLIVAIPTLVAYSILQNRIHSLSDDLTKASIRIYNLLGFSYEAVPSKKKVSGK